MFVNVYSDFWLFVERGSERASPPLRLFLERARSQATAFNGIRALQFVAVNVCARRLRLSGAHLATGRENGLLSKRCAMPSRVVRVSLLSPLFFLSLSLLSFAVRDCERALPQAVNVEARWH